MNEFTSRTNARTNDGVRDSVSSTLESSAPDAEPASESVSQASVIKRFRLAILRGIPTLLVIAILGGIAWWGHHYGWTPPKFSEITAKTNDAQTLWCDQHGVPANECIACNADLLPKGELFGWCSEHGVHECVLHNPQTSQLQEKPEIAPEDFERAARAIAARPRAENDPGCTMHLRRIQFPSIDAVNLAGIDINIVDRGPVVETIRTTGEIVYDPTRVSHLSSRASGTIRFVLRNLGDPVKRGDILAVVDAGVVGHLKAQLLTALAQLDLNRKRFERISTLGSGVIPGKTIEEAENALAASEFELDSAIQALSNLGFAITDEEVRSKPIVELRNDLKLLGLESVSFTSAEEAMLSANLIPVVAPRDGIVVWRGGVPGEVVETDSPLFTIAETSWMWVLLNVRLEEADRVTIGQKIVFHPDGKKLPVTGTITWISTTVDSQTRTVQVRGELPNPDAQLRNETFGAGEIVLREEEQAILVPNDAIHWEGCCHVAFVRDKDYFNDGSYKVFHTRSVRPGAVMGDKTEIIAGLLPGEIVVTSGSGLLRAELLKGNLGAG